VSGEAAGGEGGGGGCGSESLGLAACTVSESVIHV